MSYEHQGTYRCKPYNIHGTAGESTDMKVEVKNPPTLMKRPELQYHKSVGDKVSMPCMALGKPEPTITWRRVSFLFFVCKIEN